LRPGCARFHFLVGGLCLDLASFRLAAVAYRKSIALRPDSVKGYTALGYALSMLHDWDEAVAALRESVRVDPRDQRSQNTSIATLAKEGRHAAARQAPTDWLKQNASGADLRGFFPLNNAGNLIECATPRGAYNPPPAEREAYRKQAL